MYRTLLTSALSLILLYIFSGVGSATFPGVPLSCNASNGGCEQICETNTAEASFCRCQDGFVLAQDGKHCEELPISCNISNGGCEQICETNTTGASFCSCKDGFVLGQDRKNCKDIDECSTPKKCDHLCTNSPGSYKCSCRPGYRINGRFCDDINECRDYNGQCQHICKNLQGSYKCTCRAGYKLDLNMRSCQDINECLSNNGNCSHFCLNSDGGHKCLCSSGYTLDKDQKTCNDVDECQSGLRACSQNCHNNQGSYNCSCRGGYKLEKNGYECTDFNECLSNNGNCSHFCLNSDGGHNCLCRLGYTLDKDQKTCNDNNECAIENGGCSYLCTNEIGSFVCSCPVGFYLGLNGRTCKAKYCGHPPALPGGLYSCTDGVRGKGTYQAMCKYSCARGYILSGSTERTCDKNGNWNGTQTKCERVKCDILAKPKHSSVYPTTCLTKKSDSGSRCKFWCSKSGYVFTGPKNLHCLYTGRWSDNQLGQKCEDVEVPIFKKNCPQNIYKTTDNGKAFANVSWTPPKAIDNSGSVSMTTIPRNLKVPYAFAIGETKITYIATDPNNLKVNCSFIVEVRDIEKPTLSCPQTQTIIVKFPFVKVTWPLPNITDNSGEKPCVRSSLKIGTMVTYGTYSVTYEAKDKSGNTGVCSFYLIVRKRHCNQFPPPINGVSNCDSWLYGGFCTVSCKKGFEFAIPPARKYVCGLDGEWYPKKKPPACSGIVEAKKADVSIQFRSASLLCNNPMFQGLSGLLVSVSDSFVSSAVSKCTLYSLICTYKIVSHCDSLELQNAKAIISVKISIGNQFYNNIGKVLNKIKEEKSKFENNFGMKISIASRVRAICNQPGVVSNGKYCVRCPVDTYHKGLDCEKCPKGTSQPKEGQTKCVKTATLHQKIKSIMNNKN